MKAKEIDKIIYEELGSFFREQGIFKVLKKRSGFTCKSENNITFNLIFTHIDRRDYHKYEFNLGIYLEEIEGIRKRSLGLEVIDFMGYAEVLGLSYFIDNNFFNRNLEWEIWDKDDIMPMLKQVKEVYANIVDFIDNNSSYEKILTILEFIAEKDIYEISFERILILSKLLGTENYQQKVEKYRNILVDNDMLDELDIVVNYLEKNY